MLLIIWLRLGNLFLNLIRNNVYGNAPQSRVCGLRGVFVCGCATLLRLGADARTERPYIVDLLCSLRSEFDCRLFRVQYFDVIPDRV